MLQLIQKFTAARLLKGVTLWLVIAFAASPLLVSAAIPTTIPDPPDSETTGDPPRWLYRVDFRNYGTIYANGFAPYGQNFDLLNHIRGTQADRIDNNDGFVSTTDSWLAARNLADTLTRERGIRPYIYAIRARPGYYGVARTFATWENEVRARMNETTGPGHLLENARLSYLNATQSVFINQREWFYAGTIPRTDIYSRVRYDPNNTPDPFAAGYNNPAFVDVDNDTITAEVGPYPTRPLNFSPYDYQIDLVALAPYTAIAASAIFCHASTSAGVRAQSDDDEVPDCGTFPKINIDSRFDNQLLTFTSTVSSIAQNITAIASASLLDTIRPAYSSDASGLGIEAWYLHSLGDGSYSIEASYESTILCVSEPSGTGDTTLEVALTRDMSHINPPTGCRWKVNPINERSDQIVITNVRHAGDAIYRSTPTLLLPLFSPLIVAPLDAIPEGPLEGHVIWTPQVVTNDDPLITSPDTDRRITPKLHDVLYLDGTRDPSAATQVGLWYYDGTIGQYWHFDKDPRTGLYRIWVRKDGYQNEHYSAAPAPDDYLSLTQTSVYLPFIASGTPTSAINLWRFIKVSDGYYNIVNHLNGKYLTDFSVGRQGNNVRLVAPLTITGQAQQIWRIWY